MVNYLFLFLPPELLVLLSEPIDANDCTSSTGDQVYIAGWYKKLGAKIFLINLNVLFLKFLLAKYHTCRWHFRLFVCYTSCY